MVRLKVPLKRIHQHSDVDWQIRPENEPTKASGSTQGHPFFGNQYTNKEGQSGSDLWDSKGARQEFGSAETSINEKKMPSSISRIDWKSGTINADIGGGRFDNVTQHLATKGVTNHIYDPCNRSPEHNSDVAEKIKDGQAHTVTVNNVLNVIKEPEARDRVIRQAVKDDGKSYFQIYEGAHADGVGRETTKGWQENRKTGSYVPEIAKHFGKVSKSGNLIIAEKPLRQSKLSGRNLWGREGLQW
jgi:hypothetical protein